VAWNKQNGELVALEARVRNWHDRLPPVATRMRQELAQLLTDIEVQRGKWGWGRGVDDLADRVTRLEGTRVGADRLLEELGQATSLLEGLVDELHRLADSLPMPALQKRLTEETAKVTKCYSVRLNDDAIAVEMRTAKDVLRQFTLTREAVTLLVDGRKVLPRADEASAAPLQALIARVAADLDQRSVTTSQIEELSNAVAACRAAGASRQTTRTVERPAASPAVPRHELELLLREARHWVRVLGGAVPDAKTKVEELDEAFDRLSRDPSGDGGLLAALHAFRDEMVGVATGQRKDREARLGLDVRLLTNVLGTDQEFERPLELLKNQSIGHPDDHVAHGEESGRLERSLDDRVQTSARQLSQYWADASTQMRARFEEVQKKPRKRARAGQVDALRRDFEREAMPDGGPTNRPHVVLAHIRQLEELRVKLEKLEVDRRGEEDAFRKSLQSAIDAAATWRALAIRTEQSKALEEVLASFDVMMDELTTSAPILDDLQPRLDAANAASTRIARAIEAQIDSQTKDALSSRADLAQELEQWSQAIADVPFEWSGGSTVEQLTLAIDELERWKRGIERALTGAAKTYLEQRTQLMARLTERASAPSIAPDDAARVRDVIERCPGEEAPSAGDIDSLRGAREWLLEAETLLDTLDRAATEVARTVDSLRKRVRDFRERGFHEYHPFHYERLVAVAGGLPGAAAPPAVVVPQLQHLRTMLDALEQDALRRTVEQVAFDLARLQAALDRATDAKLKERGQRLLKDVAKQGGHVVPSLAQRNALSSLLRSLPE
jgi:hypothetical protein